MTPRNSLARRKARELLKAAGVDKPPVPVGKLAKRVGAVVRRRPFEGQMSGMVHRQPDGKATIGINSKQAATRQRFTIAHEIGHLILQKDENLHADEASPIGFRTEVSAAGIEVNEIEANQFAAELLMPVYLLKSEIQNLPENIETEEAIVRLADRFKVSIQAMTFRLSGLGILK